MLSHRRSQQSEGLSDVAFVVLAVVCFVLSPRAVEATARLVRVSRQVAVLWSQYVNLTEEKVRLQALADFVKTDAGREMLIQARCRFYPRGAVAVVVDEPAPSPLPAPSGLRRVFSNMSRRVCQMRELFGLCSWLLSQSHNPRFPASAEVTPGA